MRRINKPLRIFIIIILTILGILFINFLRINIHYIINKKEYIEIYDIQGTREDYVPQGITYSQEYNIILQTSYNNKHNTSMLYITECNSGKLLKSLKIKDSKGNYNTKHVGGITTDENKVWITNDFEMSEFELNEIVNTKKDYIKSKKDSKLYNRGDFCYYYDGILWIGDFYLRPFYNAPYKKPLLIGYDVTNIDYKDPSYVMALPKMVQGMTIVNDKFIFSQSYSYLINSTVSVYNNPMNREASTYNLKDKEVPYYEFKNSDLDKKYKLPPMIEGIFYKDKELYMLFESSSSKYTFAIPKIKKILKIKLQI